MHIADGGMIADGMALVRILQPAQNVPRRSDGQKQQKPGDRLERTPAPPLAGERKIGNCGAGKEHRRDQSLGEQRQRHAGPGPVHQVRAAGLETFDQCIERGQQKESEHRLGNDESRKQKRPHRSQHAQARIETGPRTPRAAGPQPREPREREHGERVGQMRGKGVFNTRYAIEAGDDPVRQRRFFNVADAVGPGTHPVAGSRNVLRGLGVAGVDIVKKRGCEQGRKVNRKEDNGKK